jgi:hypothetical protein
MICSAEECTDSVYGRGMCKNHWQRWYKDNPGPRRRVCMVDGCDKPRVGLGLCGKHYGRAKRRGTAEDSRRMLARAEGTSEDGTRKCYVCDRRKPRTPEFFNPDKRTKDGMRGTCKECARRASRRWFLGVRYSSSEEEFERILTAQDGKCAICSVALGAPGGAKRTLPHIDHSHKTRRVRGILCHHCNVLLGHAEEDIGRLRLAIAYLQERA